MRHSRYISNVLPQTHNDIVHHTHPSPFTYGIKEEQTSSTIPSFTNAEHFQNLALNYIKKSHRTYQENQVVISYLYNLSPFNQIISESAEKEGENIIRNLSHALKYEYVKSNSLVFNYGDESDKFYLILKGKVDMIVPNEEEVELSEVEYYLYLLKLREYNEMKILNKVITKNYSSYSFEEKSFDLWVKRAYNTIKVLKYGVRENMLYQLWKHNKDNKQHKPPHRRKSSSSSTIQLNINNDNKFLNKRARRSSMLNSLHLNYSLMNDNNLNTNENNNKEDIYTIFDSPSKRNLVLRLEAQIFRTVHIISPHLPNDIIPDTDNNISNTQLTTESYINRTKPIKFISDSSSLRKLIKITTYFQATSLKTGDTFGEITTDITQSSSLTERVVSVITNNPCHFGTLNKIAYNKCLKDINEKLRKAKLNFFFNLSIFSSCDRNLFVKSFCDFFTKKTYTTQQILFKQHEHTDHNNRIIYFIRDGELESTCNISINEINKLLMQLHYDEFISGDDEIEEDSIKHKKMNMMIIDKRREELINKKTKMRLQFYKENDVIGLDDCLFKEKYLYECKCVSPQATVYEIYINYFKMILGMDSKIKEKVEIQENIKRNLMVKMLMKYKRTRIEVFEYYDRENIKKRMDVNKKKNRVLVSIEEQFGFKNKDDSKKDTNKCESRKSVCSKKTVISKTITNSFKGGIHHRRGTSFSPSSLLSNNNIMENSLLRSKYDSMTNNTFMMIPNIKSNHLNSKRYSHLPTLSLSPPSITKVNTCNLDKRSHQNISSIHNETNIIIKHNRHSRNNTDLLYSNINTSPYHNNGDNDIEEIKEIKNYTRPSLRNNNLLLKCKPPKYLSSKKTYHLLNSLTGFFHPTITKPSSIFNINHKAMFLSPSNQH